ncbi:MAG: permease-like cell division protein FtsX [Candidatus Moranbacteria bacterium]|nr:permease-like cell division protein FtsX [Candidatus Moranbacteria bacterium]
MFLKLARTFKTGFQNFYRNGLLSVLTISVIVIAIFIINIQAGVTYSENLLLENIKNRVSISVYFDPETPEGKIKSIRNEFQQFGEVESVEYVSKEQALKEFKAENEDSEILQQSIEELDENPFEASLGIKAYNPSDYQLIAEAIKQGQYSDTISSVNYDKYESVIDNLSSQIESNRKIGFILGGTLSLIAILITFNSIRITMYAYGKEIEIMKLVGASNNYIRMPFIWEGLFYGVISSLIALPLSYGYLKFVATNEVSGSIMPFSSGIYLNEFLNGFFMENLVWIILAEIAAGILLGVVSSVIAIRKYLQEPNK